MLDKNKWKEVNNRQDVLELREYIINSFKDLQFKEETHQYFLHGKELKSVSKIVSEFSPKFDKDAWSKICYEKYYDKEDSKYYGMTPKQILDEWSRISKESCDIGNEKHSYNEMLFDYYTGKIEEITLPEEDDYMNWNSIYFWDDLSKCYIPILSECRVYQEDLGYSGTFDLLCAWDRPEIPLSQSLVLFDYKSNRDLFKNYNDQRMLFPFDFLQNSPLQHYNIQLSLYQIPLETIGCKVVDRLIIHLNNQSFGNKNSYGKYKTDDYTKELINVIKK